MNKGKYVRSFTCWNQMLCMIFGQLTGRDSMHELMLCLEAHKKKFYHLGFGITVTRRNFGKANANRDYRIYEEFAITMIELDREFVFITNNMELDAKDIAMLYKNRWHVELFFYEKHIIMQSCRQSRIDIQQDIHTTSRFNFA